MRSAIRWFRHSRVSGFVLVLLLLLSWQEASVHHVLDPVFIPPVSDILHAWVNVMRDGSLGDALSGTLTRFAVSYALAVIVGITVGVLLGWWRSMYALLEPMVE